jgi:hypothetical protein
VSLFLHSCVETRINKRLLSNHMPGLGASRARTILAGTMIHRWPNTAECCSSFAAKLCGSICETKRCVHEMPSLALQQEDCWADMEKLRRELSSVHPNRQGADRSDHSMDGGFCFGHPQ